MQIQPMSHLAEALEFLSRLPKEHEGRTAWDSDALDRGTFELIYNLSFRPSIDDYVKDGAIWHALTECARAKDFSTSFFIRKLRTYLEGLLSKEKRSFTAVMQLNAQGNAGLPKRIVSVGGAVEIQGHLSRACMKVIGKLEGYERERLNLQDDFVYMTTKVVGTQDRSALDIAYDRMKYALGIINLAARGYGVSKRFGFPNAPIGTFLSASPIFIVDTAAGKLGNWQSENHYPMAWKRNFRVWQAQDAGAIMKFAKHIASDLSRIDFKERLVQAVLLFQEGLESGQIEVALLKFWTGIERLCAREEKEATERIVERASSIFDDHRHAVMRLNFMQEFRNKIVHRGEAGDHALLCAQYGSLYLAALIRFFLWNVYKFRERDVILDFLSLPLDEKKLADSISLRRTRLRAAKRMAARIAANA
ncbi:MAG: hypothetical protein JWP25_6073 [Bradyrhizobium sp.]|nr:hypothetical protein [Bradyrhizobium sp.]